uniref:Uncharacterized protein n=1 Tax=Hucho hucho TaxID=62062 RepID=A0A4W5KR16_9TELE
NEVLPDVCIAIILIISVLAVQLKDWICNKTSSRTVFKQYFVFDYYGHQERFFDKVIKLSVMHTKIMKGFCVGSFKLDVGTVHRQPGKRTPPPLCPHMLP